jgi:hypothetical protein
MSTTLIALIDAEIIRLRQARAAFAETGKRGPGRPAKSATAPIAKLKQKRKMSPEGRARLLAAVKARWARQKKVGKKSEG